MAADEGRTRSTISEESGTEGTAESNGQTREVEEGMEVVSGEADGFKTVRKKRKAAYPRAGVGGL